MGCCFVLQRHSLWLESTREPENWGRLRLSKRKTARRLRAAAASLTSVRVLAALVDAGGCTEPFALPAAHEVGGRAQRRSLSLLN